MNNTDIPGYQVSYNYQPYNPDFQMQDNLPGTPLMNYPSAYTTPFPQSGGPGTPAPGANVVSPPQSSMMPSSPPYNRLSEQQTQKIQGMIPNPNWPDIISTPVPVTAESLQYLNGFLRTQIGRTVRVEFLIGSNTMTDRTGVLVAVGANYILLNETETDDLLACDYYNIKFIRFYY